MIYLGWVRESVIKNKLWNVLFILGSGISRLYDSIKKSENKLLMIEL